VEHSWNIEDNDEEEATAIFSARGLGISVPPSRPTVHMLVHLDGTEAGKPIHLPPDRPFSLGRREDCDLVLRVDGVSRAHARLVPKTGGFEIHDLGSSNGTVVSGKDVKVHDLKDGDIIRIGPHVRLKYSVTDKAEANLLFQMWEASVRDSLTGAFNREYLSERLKAEFAFAQRHNTDTALIMFDLDHFKKVNDTYGHQAGDAVLIETCRMVMSSLRAEDILSRYGGEEFAISARGIDIAGASQLAERLRRNAGRTIQFERHQIPVTASLGCAALSELGANPSPEALIAIADRRLYLAKTGGRNRVVSTG
jgi:two-component system, cell cycle response regulator